MNYGNEYVNKNYFCNYMHPFNYKPQHKKSVLCETQHIKVITIREYNNIFAFKFCMIMLKTAELIKS